MLHIMKELPIITVLLLEFITDISDLDELSTMALQECPYFVIPQLLSRKAL